MNSKHYVEEDQGNTHMIYGPFESLKAARRAAFFHNHPNAVTDAIRNGSQFSGRRAFASSVYEEEELAYSVQDPKANGFEAIELRDSAPLHPEWAALKSAFSDAELEGFFEKAYAHTFGR